MTSNSELKIGHFRKDRNSFVCPSKFCISIVFVFSSDHCKSQEKTKTMLTQNLEGQTKSIMVFSKMTYSIQKCTYIGLKQEEESWSLQQKRKTKEIVLFKSVRFMYRLLYQSRYQILCHICNSSTISKNPKKYSGLMQIVAVHP